MTNYVFDPVKFSDLQGKTGPYLLYSTIRMKSLLKKATESSVEFKKITTITNEYDRAIMIGLLNINNVLMKSYKTKSLNEIAEHLYKITNLFNNFYSQNRILTEENAEVKESWLCLSRIVYENNLKLLNILGIDVPDRM